jgi:hypothetical protein
MVAYFSRKSRFHRMLACGRRLKDSTSLWAHSGMPISWFWNLKRIMCNDILMWEVGESYWREGTIVPFLGKSRLHKMISQVRRLKDFTSLWAYSGIYFSWLWNYGRILCENILTWDMGESYWRERTVASFSIKSMLYSSLRFVLPF